MDNRPLLAALGPLAPLYLDDAITEILVDAPGRVYVVRDGGYQDVPGLFASAEQIRAVIDATLALNGLALSQGESVGETRLADGSRFVAVVPPTSGDAPCFSIRRLARSPIGWDRLVELKVLTEETVRLFKNLLRAEVGMLFAGSSGSGRTTLANLVAENIGDDRRVIVVQDIVDMPVRHPRALHLEANLLTKVKVAELLDTAARLSPDWLVVCEMRGPEALRTLQVMGAGPAGITLIHASGVEDALSRLESMCRLAIPGIDLYEVRSMIIAAVQIVVFQERLSVGRRVTHIAELNLHGDRIEVQTLLRYNQATDTLESAGLASVARMRFYEEGSDTRQTARRFQALRR